MLKKFFVLFLACICLSIIFTACADEHVHEYGEWTVTQAAECEKTGTKERLCSCGETEQGYFSALGHTFEDNVCVLCGAKASEGFWFTSYENGTCYINGFGKCTDFEIIFPTHSPNGDTVVGIYDTAIPKDGTIRKLVFPNTVKDIGDFNGLYGLETVVIPTVTELQSVFKNCPDLKNICIPADLVSINADAFSGSAYYNDPLNWDKGALYLDNYLLTVKAEVGESFEVKEGTRLIARYVFRDCVGLKNVILPESLETIGYGAFYTCAAMEELHLPKNVSRVELGFNRNLKNITVNEDNPFYHVDENCLIETENKKLIYGVGKCVIPSDGSVTSISNTAFYQCDTIIELVLPEAITEVGDGAFNGCKNLKSVTLHQNIDMLNKSVFKDCAALERIDIGKPSLVNTWSLASCVNLKEIVYHGTMSEWESVQKGWDWEPNLDYVIICTDGTIPKSAKTPY